jgi:putative effector of murein hydrolase
MTGFETTSEYIGLAPSVTLLFVIVTGIVAAIGAVWSR